MGEVVKDTKKPAKKSSSKAAVKAVKRVEKKVSKKGEAKPADKRKALARASGADCFFAVDGTVVSDLMELADALDRMGDDVFYHHVNDERNDFANWVRGVFKEEELADKLLSQRTPEKCQIVVLRHFLR